MTHVYSKFLTSLAWHISEAFVYQIILVCHQFALFSCLTKSEYGFIGVLFSCIYLTVTVANCGFDASLSPYLLHWSSSKKAFRSTIMYHLAPTYTIIAFLYCAYAIVIFSKIYTVPPALTNPILLTILCVTIILESTKKAAKNILAIIFKNRACALAEIGMVTLYTAIVWTAYASGARLTPLLIITPLMLTSVCSLIYLLMTLMHWYRSLPETSDLPCNYTGMAKIRLATAIYQMGNLPFSSNFLVPFSAAYFDLATAGVLKIAGNSVHATSIVIQKIVGTPTSAFFANIAHSITAQRTYFRVITSHYHNIVAAYAIFLFINYHQLSAHYGASTALLPSNALGLYLLMCLVESLFIVYEKLYIIKKKTAPLLWSTVLTGLLLAFLIYYAPICTPAGILVTLLLFRSSCLAYFACNSFYAWNIRPSFSFPPLHFAAWVCVSVTCFYVFKYTH